MLGRRKKTDAGSDDGLGQRVVRISKEQIDEVFSLAESQDDYIEGLYSLVIDGFAEAQSVDGYPATNAHTDAYINGKAIAFDRQYEPHRVPGGGWMNYRWGVDSRLADWEVSLAGVRVVPKS
jgi:hypothetical protein